MTVRPLRRGGSMHRFGFETVDGDGHVVETRPDLEAYGWSGGANELIEALLDWTPRRLGPLDSPRGWARGIRTRSAATGHGP
jgi:hypothetical protein